MLASTIGVTLDHRFANTRSFFDASDLIDVPI